MEPGRAGFHPLSDSDPEMRRYLHSAGYRIGATLEVIELSSFGGPLTVRFRRRLRQVLGGGLAGRYSVAADGVRHASCASCCSERDVGHVRARVLLTKPSATPPSG